MTATTHHTQPLLDASVRDALVARVQRLANQVVVEDVYSLTPLQEGMLFHSVASVADDLYIVQQRIEITGPLDHGLFSQAWSHVVARQPALRTLFVWDYEGPAVQVVCRGLDVDVELVDLRGAPDAEAIIETRLSLDRTRRFDLDRPPLMRIALFRLGPDRHVMMWSQHHLLQDGWSASVVLDEVFAAYEAFDAGRDPALPPVRPFAGYMRWLAEQDEASAAEFWRSYFDGFSEPTRVVEAQGNPGEGEYTRRFHALTPELTSELRELARSRGLSLNSLLVGAMAIALGRYTGKGDVALGVVASGRPPDLEGVETMVGMLINTLVLRIEIDQSRSTIDWMSEVQSRHVSLMGHQHSALADVQSSSGLGAGTTLTDALFAYWNFGGTGTSPNGELTYRMVDGYGRTSFPFSVTVESADALNVGLDFDRGNFDPTAAERFLEHYATLLGSIVAAPNAPVGELQMLTAGEQATLAEYNATARPVPHGSVVDAFRAQAAATPNAVALGYGDKTLTYAELDDHSERLSQQIIQTGGLAVRSAAIYAPRSPEMVVAMLGVMKAGAAYVPIDRHLPTERVAFLLDDSGADLVVTTAELQTQLPPETPVVVLPLPAVEELDFDIPIGSGDVAYVMYTSGSTGRPKGVAVPHRALINYVWWARHQYAQDLPVSFPLYTSSGFDLTITSIYVPLVTGGRVVIYPDDDARDLAVRDVFADDAVDVVKLTPSHLAVLDDGHFRTKRIRTLILGGEDLRADLAASVHDSADSDLVIFNEYGPTEATVGCMIHRYDPSVDTAETGASVLIGRPVDNAHIYLLDAGLSPVPVGVPGRLYVGGDGLAAGYLNQAELSAERFVPDPFRPGHRMYDTGDVARWRRFGEMEYVGRSDDQVKVRGNRIELGEIEAVVAEHPAIAIAAVAVREPAPGDVRLVAYYVPEQTVGVNVTELRTHLGDRLPDFMVPRHLVQMDALPLTPNGKLDRDALPDTIGEVATSTEFVVPRTSAERLVAELGADLLGVDRVSVADNFFDLGGHSVLAMQLIARLHSKTGVRLSPRVVLLNTLAHVAALLPEHAGAYEAATDEPEVAETSRATAGSIATTAFYFGPSDEPLFGMHHAPVGKATRNRGVLLCAPLGWEYMRTHWAMRKVARLLAVDGFHALRFDYFGTGDSSGDSRAGSIDRWVDDVANAAAELRAAAGVETVSVVGVRLGATFASIAAGRGLAVDHLVLWDPVVDGHAYMDTLHRMQAEMLAERGSRGVTQATIGDDLLGFPYPPQRRRALAELDLPSVPWPDAATTVVATQDRSEYRRLVAVVPNARLDLVPDAGAWGDLASSQAALLPAVVPGHIVRVLGEER